MVEVKNSNPAEQSNSKHCLDVLPSGLGGGSVDGDSKSIEAEAVIDVASGNGGVLLSREDLPFGGSSSDTAAAVGGGSGIGSSRASNEARAVAPGAETTVLAGGVLEGTLGGALGDVARVGGGEGQSTRSIYVDLLAAGNNDVL